MATHWLREITTTATGASTGFPFGSKALAMFLKYVLSFTNEDEFVDSVGVGDSVSAPDPNPGPDQNKQTLSDSEGRFVGSATATDVGKDITISGMTDPSNDGTFTITDFVSATQIKYVNAGGSAESSSFDWEIEVTDEGHFSFANSGTNGSINITGSDKTFRDLVGTFTGSGWILIRDLANPENSGWYAATYVDANNVTLDFRSGAAEYPTQNLGANLSWWFAGDSYEVPQRRDAWFRIQTPHATGWEIEVKMVDAGAFQAFQVRLAIDANWSGSKVLGIAYMGVDDGETTWFYCAANSEGEFINFFFHNATADLYGGFIAADIDLFDVDRTADESVALMGCASSSSTSWAAGSTYEKVTDNTCVSWGWLWTNRPPDTIQNCQMMELSWNNSDDGFSQWASAEANARISSVQFLEGQPIIVDEDNVQPIGEYEIVGSLKGVFGAHHVTGGDKTAYTDPEGVGTLNRFHVFDGLGIEWPGVTAQH
jgi:hypothetical protein